MIRFPSIRKMVDDALNTFLRFPFVIIIAFIGTIVSILMIDRNYGAEDEIYVLANVLQTCFIGLVLYISIDLFAEMREFSLQKQMILRFVATAFLIVYYFLLPVPFLYVNVYRTILLLIALHLLVSFIPFLIKGKQKAFWNFNQLLFIRIVLSLLFSAILFTGLAVAIGAASYLFDLNVQEETYAHLWIIIVGIFNTWLFLAGLPQDFDYEEDNLPYPFFLKILAQFILFPLVAIYFLILYIYMIKIGIEVKMPANMTAYMVLGFSIMGIFSLLLVYPLQDSESNRWIRTFSKWFYVALLPLIVLLFLAISVRVNQYGITENRYFIILLALWLLGISIYMLIRRQKDIKIIPISLAILAFLSSMGPLSGFTISKYSQLNQLEKVLIENKVLIDGEFHEIDTLNYDVNVRIESIVHYLTSTHGHEPFQKFFKDIDLDSIYTANNNYNIKPQILKLMKIKSVYYNDYAEAEKSFKRFYFAKVSATENIILVKDYDYYGTLNLYSYDNNQNQMEMIYNFDDKELKIEYDNLKDSLYIKIQDNSYRFDITEMAKKINDNYKNTDTYNKDDNYNYSIQESEMILVYEDNTFKMKILFSHLDGKFYHDGDVAISTFGANILFKIK